MLADEGETLAQSGGLSTDLHLPKEWVSSLITFIARALPAWRDDPRRPAQTSENKLSAQLCGRLNSLCRQTGWDFLQFRREEPDETDASRSIDLVASPAGSVIWIEAREYNEYESLIPIECKRLPTPEGSKRDPREYLVTGTGTTGGIQRFKAGHHGANHERAAMIGYIQACDVSHWNQTVGSWIDDLAKTSSGGWSNGDKLVISNHDKSKRVATLESTHVRAGGITPSIQIDHLWIEM